MNRTLFARIIDTTFIVVGISIVMYAWLFKFIKNFYICLVITSVISFCVAKIFWQIDKKNYNKFNLKKHEIKHIEVCIDYLSKHQPESKHFFIKLFDISQVSGNFFFSKDCVYYIDFTSEKINFDTICKIANKQNNSAKQFVLLCCEISAKATAYAKEQNIKILSPDELYIKMKEKNLFPKELEKEVQKKLNIKETIKSSINKKKAKQYILYGALLIVLGLFVPFTSWYIFVGTIFICLAILSLFIKTKSLS